MATEGNKLRVKKSTALGPDSPGFKSCHFLGRFQSQVCVLSWEIGPVVPRAWGYQETV